MKRLSLILLLLPLACAHLPKIQAPADPHGAPSQEACTQIFPQGRWQFVHAIEAVPPGGRRINILGVIQTASQERTVKCVLLTLEGLVLFQASYDHHLTIERAIPPFDAKGFAQGLLNDIMLIFFAPQAPCRQTGYLASGDFVCRYSLSNQGTLDIVRKPHDGWEIRRYNASNRLERTVSPIEPMTLSARGFPTHLELRASGLAGYRLTLTLLEARPL